MHLFVLVNYFGNLKYLHALHTYALFGVCLLFSRILHNLAYFCIILTIGVIIYLEYFLTP